MRKKDKKKPMKKCLAAGALALALTGCGVHTLGPFGSIGVTGDIKPEDGSFNVGVSGSFPHFLTTVVNWVSAKLPSSVTGKADEGK